MITALRIPLEAGPTLPRDSLSGDKTEWHERAEAGRKTLPVAGLVSGHLPGKVCKGSTSDGRGRVGKCEESIYIEVLS